MRDRNRTRRDAISSLGVFAVGAPLADPEQALGDDRSMRLPPVDELVNVLEFEDPARLRLGADVYSTIAGGDRESFERITFRPRHLVSSASLDLTTELLGVDMFAPIIVGPVSQQQRFHPDGELETVRGAGVAKAIVVVSDRASYPSDRIAREAAGSMLWCQLSLDRPGDSIKAAEEALRLGYKAIFVTVGNRRSGGTGTTVTVRPDWEAAAALTRRVAAPIVLKGVMTTEDALRAVDVGFRAIVVSNGGVPASGQTPVEVLPAIVDAVKGRVPVLIDGGVRRGTDALKALALGARAVLIGRPAMWGLAAYGADGVRTVIELLQTELARAMINSGRPTITSIDRTLIRIHASTWS